MRQWQAALPLLRGCSDCHFLFKESLENGGGFWYAGSPRTAWGRETSVLQRVTASILAVWPPIVLLCMNLTITMLPIFWVPVRIMAGIGLIISIVDITARIKDSRKVMETLSSAPSLLPRHISRYKRSWCQRTVLEWSAYGALGETARRYVAGQYASMGYRFFHIFPDRAFTKDSPFLKMSFYRSLVGGTPAIRMDMRDPAE